MIPHASINLFNIQTIYMPKTLNCLAKASQPLNRDKTSLLQRLIGLLHKASLLTTVTKAFHNQQEALKGLYGLIRFSNLCLDLLR